MLIFIYITYFISHYLLINLMKFRPKVLNIFFIEKHLKFVFSTQTCSILVLRIRNAHSIKENMYPYYKRQIHMYCMF